MITGAFSFLVAPRGWPLPAMVSPDIPHDNDNSPPSEAEAA